MHQVNYGRRAASSEHRLRMPRAENRLVTVRWVFECEIWPLRAENQPWALWVGDFICRFGKRIILGETKRRIREKKVTLNLTVGLEYTFGGASTKGGRLSQASMPNTLCGKRPPNCLRRLRTNGACRQRAWAVLKRIDADKRAGNRWRGHVLVYEDGFCRIKRLGVSVPNDTTNDFSGEPIAKIGSAGENSFVREGEEGTTGCHSIRFWQLNAERFADRTEGTPAG